MAQHPPSPSSLSLVAKGSFVLYSQFLLVWEDDLAQSFDPNLVKCLADSDLCGVARIVSTLLRGKTGTLLVEGEQEKEDKDESGGKR